MNTEKSQLEYRNGPNFVGLVIKTTLLTFITLGIYRFWQKARLRRHYWSAVHMKGDPFEYTGTGLEAFLGFLIVIVILAVYLGGLVTVLYFMGFATMANLTIIQVISWLALLPLIFIAQYRFRQFLAARSRWRGIRFGMEKGAFGFMLRGLGYTLLGIITLGLSGPIGRFKLDQYQTNRTWLGDYQFKQEGNWKNLYRYYAPFWASMLLVIAGGAMLLMDPVIMAEISGISDGTTSENSSGGSAFGLIFGGYFFAIIFMFHYMVRSNVYLFSQTKLNNEIGFEPKIWTRGFIGRYILGALLSMLVAGLVLTAIFIILAIIGLIISIIFPDFNPFLSIDFEDPNSAIMAILAIYIPIYIIMFVATRACSEIFVKAVMIEYVSTRIAVTNPNALDKISQREGDDQLDADGLGQAFDVGFGF